ncbi:MAG: hypothetical protein DI536_20075 [Archangium gephyra]|uniref:Uncharacterized protein n=1 Tax=Archangium gephyra TaxID=48 RepID=A0A2W5VJG1_9BACT|nr:MAG: hypothetical protein DI536_20075 [Archangium gephyra]
MLFALVVFVVSAAPPEVFDCKARKCRASKQKGDVWKVTLPKVKRDDGVECREAPEEYWLVPKSGPAQLLLEVCNDGYGASGVGEDSIDITANGFKHSRYGGSAWRWTSATELAFSPLRVVSESESNFNATMPGFTKESSWNWDTFRGKQVDEVAKCRPDGSPDIDSEESVHIESSPVPVVLLSDAFRNGGWKTTSLGACSVPASFVTFGKQSGKNDASLSAIATFPEKAARELYLEVRDDAFVTEATKWTLADHVELWFASSAGAWDECVGTRGGVQFGVSLDGKVNVGFGEPNASALSVEVARADGVVRMKVLLTGLPDDFVGIVYSDSDDGKKQKALLATSQLKFASVPTFSGWKKFPRDIAACDVSDGALKPKNTRVFEPKTAVIE